MPLPSSSRSSQTIARSLRAITGLYLLAYVTVHLINLSLGLVSLDAMDAARPYLSGIWTGPYLRSLLTLALLVHYVLGLWTIYKRPSLTGTSQDLIQALSGLLIPPLMMSHLVGTGMLKNVNVDVDYVLINQVFWLSNPGIGLMQVLLISIVWIHGCAGFFMILRARAGAVHLLPWLYPIAVAVPVVALLGYTQAGRAVLALGIGPVIEQVPNADGSPAPPVPFVLIKQVTNWLIWSTITISIVVICARLIRIWLARPAMVQITTTGVGKITGQTGQSLLDAFRAQDQPHASLCSGRGRCGTCTVRIIASSIELAPPTPLEQATLDRIKAEPGNRLACQLPLDIGGTLEVERINAPDHTFQPKSAVPSSPAQQE